MLQDFEFTEGRKLVDHSQQLVFVGGLWTTVFKLHLISQEPHDHIDHDTHERPQPVFVIWLSDDVEADRIRVVQDFIDRSLEVTGDAEFALVFGLLYDQIERLPRDWARQAVTRLLERDLSDYVREGGPIL